MDGDSLKGCLTLVKAGKEDSREYCEWWNDPLVRENFFKPNEISFEVFDNWFQKALSDNGRYFLLGMVGKEKIGILRFEWTGRYWEGSIVIRKENRGMGLASEFIEKGLQHFSSLEPSVKEIFASIKKGNIPSIKAFEKAGFCLSDQNEKGAVYKYKKL